LIIQVYLLATPQTSSTFDLTLSNLVPSGQTALASSTSILNAGLTYGFGNVNRSFLIDLYIRNILLNPKFLN